MATEVTIDAEIEVKITFREGASLRKRWTLLSEIVGWGEMPSETCLTVETPSGWIAFGPPDRPVAPLTIRREDGAWIGGGLDDFVSAVRAACR
jgi:hypothetical protein